MNNKVNISPILDIEFSTPDHQSFFFGYYNYSPISSDGTRMLAHRTYFEGRNPTADDKVDIGYFDLVSKKWHKISTSRAFNWQQGSMLQWMGSDFNSKIIFNDILDNKFVARIVDLKNNTSRTIPHAVYGMDPQGKFSLSLIFERCHWTRAYSYPGVKNEYWNERIHPEDGIIKVDLESGQAERIIGIEDILNLSGETYHNSDAHWFEHIMMNPGGTRFAFYHRFGSNSDFYTKVFTADVNGENIWGHPYQRGDRYSHLGWRDDHSYVVFTRPANKKQESWKNLSDKKNHSALISVYRKMIKPLLPRRVVQSVINSKNNYALTLDQQEIVGNINSGMLSRDGHPSFSKDRRYMLTDTYEDKNGFRKLLLYDMISEKVIHLGDFFSVFNSCGWRADLHPRFSPDEKSIIVDSSSNGHHQMFLLRVDWGKILQNPGPKENPGTDLVKINSGSSGTKFNV